MPPRIYIAGTRKEKPDIDRAIPWGLPSPTERFDVGKEFEVTVYDIEGWRLPWLALPFPPAPQIRFPLSLPAATLALARGVVVERGSKVAATGEEGTVVYGPYVHVPAGRYRARWLGEGVDSAGQVAFEVASTTLLAAPRVVGASGLVGARDGELAVVEFEVSSETALEFRVISGGGGRVLLSSVELERR